MKLCSLRSMGDTNAQALRDQTNERRAMRAPDPSLSPPLHINRHKRHPINFPC